VDLGLDAIIGAIACGNKGRVGVFRFQTAETAMGDDTYLSFIFQLKCIVHLCFLIRSHLSLDAHCITLFDCDNRRMAVSRHPPALYYCTVTFVEVKVLFACITAIPLCF